jgi:hypothetical protein
MSDKNSNNTKKETNKIDDILLLVEKKIEFFKDIIQKTILHVQKNKLLEILAVNDVNLCVEKLLDIDIKINELTLMNINNTEMIVNNLQTINNELSTIFKNYGTTNLEDLLLICFGNNSKISNSDKEYNKFELLKKYFHPISYKVIGKKEDNKKKVKMSDNEDKMNNLDCFDISSEYKQYYVKVYGIKLYIYNNFLKKGLLIYGVVDDVNIKILNNEFINNIHNELNNHKYQDETLKLDVCDKFISSLILKDYLIYTLPTEIINKYAGYVSNLNNLKQKAISQIVKDFVSDDLFSKRMTLIQLLIKPSNYENQYLAYLLYDLLSNDSNGNIDTVEQTALFDSLPWVVKQYFKNAMKKTIQYTNDLSNFEMNKIPLEQQICLLKTSDSVKEKAMMKLKEVKAKSEDSGSKARQYLDGLLKIPFNIYKREPILKLMDNIKNKFNDFLNKNKICEIFPEIPFKEKYTSIEILKYCKKIKIDTFVDVNDINKIIEFFITGDKNKLLINVSMINDLLIKYNLKEFKINNYQSLKKDEIKELIKNKLLMINNEENSNIMKANLEIKQLYKNNYYSKLPNNLSCISNEVNVLNTELKKINDYMNEVKVILDKSVYGHNKAKKQIERVFGQWINGDGNSNESHILGFEGNPGIGKTTLAKGIAKCLKDENGKSRPFSLIAIGGDSNASSLIGHSYTYVGSNYGKIVQILIDSKCMNPIILIDEVDKISRTENGKEIIGILTHLLDSTQNDTFEDKYFSGIPLDLSKALFILSYNDVTAIDKILLDRVHRIKFDSLSIEDKIVICNTHLLPELYKKIGLEDMIYFSDDVLKFIIEEYTLEPGVRKLKEKLFEIVGEINLNILKNIDEDILIPINVTIEDIKNKYFKDKREIKIHKIHDESKVGLINALWANEMSQGGVLPLQVSFIPSNKFLDLTLTGSMGDVMKESISVSLTNAWNLTSKERQMYLIEKYNDTKNNHVFGLHIHCPNISTKKDGPSATTAFTVLIYSLFNDIKIKNYFGITGETSFDYQLTEIGGLQEKIIHSIKAGIKEFIYPKENQYDFDKIMEKYKDKDIIKGIKFHSINHIDEVLKLILDV